MTVASILTHLQSDSDLNDLVSGRIYRSRIPQNPKYPLVKLRSSADDEGSLEGNLGVYNIELALEIYGKDYVALDDVKQKLKTALSNSSVFESLCISEADDDYIDENKNYSIFLDYSIWF